MESAELLSPNTAVPRNCWLCERWIEKKFEVRVPNKFIDCVVKSVYIHLSFEDYRPMVMTEQIEA